MRELRSLPEDAWERAPGAALVRVLVSRLGALDPAEKETAMELEETYAQREARVRAEGKAEGAEEGRAAGLRGAIRDACAALRVEWTDERARAFDALGAPDLSAIIREVLRARAWPAERH